jgi:hypothetical protein
MSRAYIEPYDAGKHQNHMPEIDGHVNPNGHVIVVESGRYRLEFLSLAQLDAAIAFFEKPTGSTRMDPAGGDHWEFQPWQSRLPKGIVNAKNRPKILSVLRSAKELCSHDRTYRPASA